MERLEPKKYKIVRILKIARNILKIIKDKNRSPEKRITHYKDRIERYFLK